MRSVIVQLLGFVLFFKPDFIVLHKEMVLNIRHLNRHGHLHILAFSGQSFNEYLDFCNRS